MRTEETMEEEREVQEAPSALLPPSPPVQCRVQTPGRSGPLGGQQWPYKQRKTRSPPGGGHDQQLCPREDQQEDECTKGQE